MTTTPHGQVPAIQRYKIGYHSDEWGVRSLSPVGIYDDAGPWVRYEDHAAELCRLHAYCQELESQVIRDCMTHVQKPAEIEHVAGDVSKNSAKKNMNDYAELPEPDATTVGLGAVWNRHSMRDFADATHALRTQQPVPVLDYPPLPECDATTVGLGAVWNRHSMRAYVDADRAARAPAPSVLEDAALSGEEQRAIFEAYESAASESYFEARPQIDCNDRRRVFKAGYERGWDAARKQGGA